MMNAMPPMFFRFFRALPFFVLVTMLSMTAPTIAVAKDTGILAYASLDGNDRLVRVHTPTGALNGVYFPTSELDHDKPEITRPDRYRLPGRFGGALTFFADEHSFVEVPGFSFAKSQPELVISLFMKTRRSRTSTLVSNRSDSSFDGFALVSRLNRLHFYYGDGSQKFMAKSDHVMLSDGNWHWVKLVFKQGEVRFYVDNEHYGTQQFHGKVVTSGTSTLTFGNYPLPGRGREHNSFGGQLDEIIVASREDAVVQLMQQRASDAGESSTALLEKNIFDATVQPVDGNEMHFQGQRLFHTFAGQPVPLSFLFKGNAEEAKSASMVMYVPERIACREVFISAHHLTDQAIALSETSVTRHGEAYRKYETQGYNLASDKLAKTFSVMLAVALDAADPGEKLPADARIDWGYVINGKEVDKTPFTLRFLQPRSAVTHRGRFEVMNYFLANGMAFHDSKLQNDIAQLYLTSGITGKGRFYSHDRRRVAFDNALKQKGFTLYNISLWQGPFSKQAAPLIAEGFAKPAIGPDGQTDLKHPCPTDIIQSETFQTAYREMVKNKLSASQDNEWVAYDWEPWGLPGNFCFCEKTLADFRSRYDIKEPLTPSQIKEEYRESWTRFWLDMADDIYRVWGEAVHAANPTLKITDYTYVHNYDDPNLLRRFYDIPKDPRRLESYVDEHMMSVYNFHGRNLFNSLSQNINVLKKPIMPIVLLSRPHELMSYTTPVGSLSPQRIYQRAVLVASLGCQRMGLYPGKWIDGAYHEAIGRASQLIWDHESFYFDGERCDDKVSVKPTNSRHKTAEFAYVMHEKDGAYAMTLFNFSNSEQTYNIKAGKLNQSITRVIAADGQSYEDGSSQKITVQPHDLAILKWLP